MLLNHFFKLFGIAFLLNISTKVNGQKIIDIFNLLPDNIAINIPKETKKQMYVDYKSGNNNNTGTGYRFGIVDTKNAYLNVQGTFDGKWEMCYWNLSNGQQLVAVYYEGCGPVCAMEVFDFYKYDGKNLTRQDFNKIIPDVENDFFKNNPEKTKKELEQKDIIAVLLYQLPKKGTTIIAKYGNETSEEIDKKYFKANRMELIWTNGKFKKGKMYWQ